jgi:hypothetical protein
VKNYWQVVEDPQGIVLELKSKIGRIKENASFIELKLSSEKFSRPSSESRAWKSP